MKLTKFFLVLPITLFLIGCGKVTKPTTKSNTTGSNTTNGGTTTAAPTTTGGGQTTTVRPTTTNPVTTAHQSSTINFFCPNSEFKDLVNKYYSNVDVTEATKTTLKDGTVINWVQIPGGSNTDIALYRQGLDEGLSNNDVDMFILEGDYSYNYINSNYVADLTNVGIDFSKQIKYDDIFVKNESGKICGSTYGFNPGVFTYNLNVAKSIWGNDITPAEIEDKFSTKGKFEAAADDVKDVSGKYMLTGTADLWEMYLSNLSSKMWDGDSIVVDKELFRWVKDMKQYNNNGFIKGMNEMYSLWNTEWAEELSKDNVLLHVSTTFFSLYSLPCFRHNDGEYNYDDYDIVKMTDVNFRLTSIYKPYIWSGANTIVCATKKVMGNDNIKDDVIDIISKITTDYDTISSFEFKDKLLFGNNVDVLDYMSKSDSGKIAYFGGQNIFKYTLDAINACSSIVFDVPSFKASDIFYNWFGYNYLSGRDSRTLSEIWSVCHSDICTEYNLPSYKVRIHPDVTLSGDTITIA